MLFPRTEAILNGQSTRSLLLFALIIFFWALFDSAFTYVIPVVVTESGYSNVVMGILVGSSSLFGALFDYLMSLWLKDMRYRRMLVLLFALCLIAPLFLFPGYPLLMYIAAMAIWGLYFDVCNFAIVNFVTMDQPKQHFSTSYGIITMFRSLAYVIGPITVGTLISMESTVLPYSFMWAVTICAIILFVILVVSSPDTTSTDYRHRRRSLVAEARVWRNIGGQVLPVLMLTVFVSMYHSFFWTLGPLITIRFGSGAIDGLFLTLYSLPSLVIGFLVEKATRAAGKKRTALIGALLASIVLSGLLLYQTQAYVLILVVLSSTCIAFCLPSLNSTFSDYIHETKSYEQEIQGLQDFFTNIGYVIGPILAGYFSQYNGTIESFGYFGLIGIAITVCTFFLLPKHIRVHVK